MLLFVSTRHLLHAKSVITLALHSRYHRFIAKYCDSAARRIVSCDHCRFSDAIGDRPFALSATPPVTQLAVLAGINAAIVAKLAAHRVRPLVCE